MGYFTTILVGVLERFAYFHGQAGCAYGKASCSWRLLSIQAPFQKRNDTQQDVWSQIHTTLQMLYIPF